MDADDELVPGSLVRRWRLGKQLRELREQAGKTMDEAAAYLSLARPTISRIENGRFAILPRNVKWLCQLYEIGSPLVDMLVKQAEESSERGWWVSYSDTMPDWFETFVGFETDAREIWTYESELVPGLLQLPGYVRGLAPDATEQESAKSIEFRLARQQRLNTRPPLLRVVLNEAVVRREIGSPEDMASQLEHLAAVGEQPWATIQVIPFSHGPHPSMKGPFSMVTLPDEQDPNFVYLEHLDGALYLERPADLARYARAFGDLVETALSPEASRNFLVTLAEEYSGKQERRGS
jgi:transcriptional regulator with XRE-family HTH domain